MKRFLAVLSVMMAFIISALAVSSAMALTRHGVKMNHHVTGRAHIALTKGGFGGAEEITWEWAGVFWGKKWEPRYPPYECRGPYENAMYKTQWACFGNFNGTSEKWQVNVDAYGLETFHQLV